MGDQFKVSRSRNTSGSLSVSCAGNSEIVKRLQSIEKRGEVAIKRTVSDFSTRAPGWVSKGIREHYGVDTVAIKDAARKPRRGRTTIKVSGLTIDGVTLRYQGRLLTPLHFKMSPKTQPEVRQKKISRVPGQAIGKGSPVAMVRQPKRYAVKATIIKGRRTKLPAGTFVAQANGGVSLPFQRTGKGRMPIEAVRTLSVPQMIDGRAKETVNNIISTKLVERFDHHIKQTMK